MAHHGLHQRAPQLPSAIGAPTATATLGTQITTAAQQSIFTVVTTSVTIIPPPDGSSIKSPTVVATLQTFTNSADFASAYPSTTATASPKSTKASATASKSSTATASATAAAKSSSNLGTLIPAIVVPVAVVLLASLALFWFFMRRRHRRDLKNTEFVMAGKGEKLSSRSNSSRSGNTSATAAEKSWPAVSTSEVKPPMSRSGPKISLDDIGIARPLTPKDSAQPASRPRSPSRRGPPSRNGQYQNFSGPRPSTARNHPPPRSGHSQERRNRSNSSPGNRGPPPSAYGYRPNGLPQNGPSPQPRSGFSPQIGVQGNAFATQPRPAPNPHLNPSATNRLRDPSPGMQTNNRAAPAPTNLEVVPPGAFNGASPISQYSPIVKETPNIASAATFGDSKAPSPPSKPTPLQTRNLTSEARSPSPNSPNGFLTEENMRIARLANSSRLGFFTTTSATSPSAETTFNKVLPPAQTNTRSQQAVASPATASNPSPKLPPPATRSQLIPLDFPITSTTDSSKANYFSSPSASKRASGTSSHYPPRSTRTTYTARPKSTKQHKDDDADSVVSDLDAYEDIDAKSDVSSLNEFERFDFESRNESRAESARGSTRSGNQGTAHGLGMGAFGR